MNHPATKVRCARVVVVTAMSAVIACTTATPRDAPIPATEADGQKAAERGEDNPTASQTADWVLATLAQKRTPSEAELTSRVSQALLEALPVAQLRATFAELQQQLPPIVVVERKETSALSFEALLDTAAGRIRLLVEMTSVEPRKVAGLLFTPVVETPPLQRYEQALELVRKTGASSQILVSELVDGQCKPLFEDAAGEPLAVGSTFKLWVLQALVAKLASDPKLRWDDTLAIRDELKSLPSGELQERDAGTLVSLRELATKMIAISDNTASDHLVGYLGREAVERAQSESGHRSPERNVPWLTTRDLFSLKLQTSEPELAQYRAADVAAKRALLEQWHAHPLPPLSSAETWKAPRAPDLEWFASARDVCSVLSKLSADSKYDLHAETLRVLSHNPGLQLQREAWRYIGYKGGSEPGVLNLSWLLQRADGRWFVVVITVNDAAKALDEPAVLSAALGTLGLLGTAR